MAISTPFTLTWTGTTLDTQVLAFSIDQSEGDFATLSVQIPNPRIGLLAGELWATFAYAGTTLFYGRLVGIPSDLQAEVVTLTFVAKPDDYAAKKLAAATPYMVLPYYAPEFLAPEQRGNPDNVLEAMPWLFHTDRVTHAVTLSRIHQGEAGTATIPVVFYDSLHIELEDPPIAEVSCTATITWAQTAKGEVDLTSALIKKFKASGSYEGGEFLSLTATGLLKSWPKAGDNIGGGWKIAETIRAAQGAEHGIWGVQVASGGFEGNSGVPHAGGEPLGIGWVNVVYGGGLGDDLDDDNSDLTPEGASAYNDGEGWYYTNDGGVTTATYTVDWSPYYEHSWSPALPNYSGGDPWNTGLPTITGFPILGITANLIVGYDLSRPRTETVNFTIRSQVQPIITEQTAALHFDLSAQVDQPINDAGETPIGDTRRDSYILTDRGHQTLRNMLLQARARLIASARAVRITFETTLDIGIGLTLRHAARIDDPRLPGGTATGKVVGLSLRLAGSDGRASAQVTLACMVGTGAALSWPDGVPDPEVDYVEEEGEIYAENLLGQGVVVTLPTGDLAYVEPTALPPPPAPTAPDGDVPVSLSSLSAKTVIKKLVVLNGLMPSTDPEAMGTTTPDGDFADVGQYTILAGGYADTNAAIAALNEMPTRVEMTLHPIDTPLSVVIDVPVSALAVQKDIDLAAGPSGSSV